MAKITFFITLTLVSYLQVESKPTIEHLRDAKEGQFAHHVAFYDREHGYWCAGTIINKDWVLTAAHCLDDHSSPQRVAIRAGSLYYSSGETYQVEEFITHEDYNPKIIDDLAAYDNDIALVKISGGFNFSNPDINKIDLETKEIPENSRIKIVGWKDDENSFKPTKLQFSESVKASEKQSKRILEDLQDESHLVMKHSKGFGACKVTHGDPAIYNRKLVGIGSFCFSGTFDVYTKISYYVDWINNHVSGKNESDNDAKDKPIETESMVDVNI